MTSSEKINEYLDDLQRLKQDIFEQNIDTLLSGHMGEDLAKICVMAESMFIRLKAMEDRLSGNE